MVQSPGGQLGSWSSTDVRPRTPSRFPLHPLPELRHDQRLRPPDLLRMQRFDGGRGGNHCPGPVPSVWSRSPGPGEGPRSGDGRGNAGQVRGVPRLATDRLREHERGSAVRVSRRHPKPRHAPYARTMARGSWGRGDASCVFDGYNRLIGIRRSRRSQPRAARSQVVFAILGGMSLVAGAVFMAAGYLAQIRNTLTATAPRAGRRRPA